MATVTDKTQCATCGKKKATSRCIGCLQEFCFSHFVEHRQELSKQLDEIEVNRDIFQQTIIEQTTEPQKHPLIEEIDQWEEDSIQKIKQTAEEARESILRRIDINNNQREEKLNKLTNQLKQSRQEDDITEIDLQKWKEELTQLREELTKLSNMAIRQSFTPLITNINLETIDKELLLEPTAHLNISNITMNAKWIQNGITVAGGNGQGNELNQLFNPWGVYVDDYQTVYVAEYSNNRIVEWRNGVKSGQIVAGRNGVGIRNDQLSNPWNVIIDKNNDSLIISDCNNQRVVRWPRRNGTNGETIISNVKCSGLAMDNNGYLYVSDYEKHEVRRWKIGETNGTLVAGGQGQGNRFDQLNFPYFIFIDEDESVYVSDYNNHRVMKWVKGAKEGVIVAGAQNEGSGLAQLSFPCGVIVDQVGTVYVAEQGNHRVMRWLKGATQGSVVVGGNGEGGQANQLHCPIDLSFDRQYNLYVIDYNNDRVQKFNIEPNSNK